MRTVTRYNLPLIKMIGASVFFFISGYVLAQGMEIRAVKIIAIVSLKIRPYVEAVEAMEEVLASKKYNKIEVIYLDNETDSIKTRAELSKRLAEKGEGILLVAVGPEAAHLLWSDLPADVGKKIYMMVLNPEKVLPVQQPLCGISLNIPIDSQVKVIREALPAVDQIGLIFNPEHNAHFAREAVKSGQAAGVTIVPLEVTDRKEIPLLLQNNWRAFQSLWMIPDQTVITESSVPFIIKESLSKRVPVIGFNRYFYENGASLCFLFDYKDIGHQAGRFLASFIEGTPCENYPPDFKIWFNVRVLKALGVDYNQGMFEKERIGPGP